MKKKSENLIAPRARGGINVSMKHAIGTLASFALFAAFSFGAEMLSDTGFENGFNLTATSTTANPLIIAKLFPNEKKDPVWRMAQWGSNFSLADADMKRDGNISYYENDGKKVSIDRKAPKTTICFEVRAIREYEKERNNSHGWPHLLIEQEITSLPKISELKSLIVSFEVKIPKPKTLKGFKYDDNRHTAQYVMYLAVQNRNQASEGFGDYLWFGIPIFDVRHEVTPPHMAPDAGKDDATGKYIYSVAGGEFWKKSVANGKWQKFRHDMLPYIVKAFNDAKGKGYLKTSNFEDMVVANTNTGWEVTGPYDAKSELRGYSIDAEFKE